MRQIPYLQEHSFYPAHASVSAQVAALNYIVSTHSSTLPCYPLDHHSTFFSLSLGT
jgi:hypothetical protein